MGLCRKCATGSPGACANAKDCQSQRENLIDEAMLLAESFGHTLCDFTKLNGAPIWQTKGTICGRTLSVRLDALYAEGCVSGEAASDFCCDHDDVGRELEQKWAVP